MEIPTAIISWWIAKIVATRSFIIVNYVSPATDIPADNILELFGKTFFEFCQDSGYDKILQVLGATPRDFLQVSSSGVGGENIY